MLPSVLGPPAKLSSQSHPYATLPQPPSELVPSQPVPQLPSRNLSEDLHERVIRCHDAFCLRCWQTQASPHFSYCPYTSFIPSHLQQLILTQFERIQDFETLSELLVGWEHIEQHGQALFEEIRRLNVEFESL